MSRTPRAPGTTSRWTVRLTAVGLLLASVCGCSRRSEVAGPARDVLHAPAGGDAGTAAAPQDPELTRRLAEAARSTEPYIRWLLGFEDGSDASPPASFADVWKAAACPAAAVASAQTTLTRFGDLLGVSWEIQAQPEREPCAELVTAVRGVLSAAGYAPAQPAGDSGGPFELVADGVRRMVAFECVDGAYQPEPGCTPPCMRPTGITLTFGLALPAAELRSFEDGFILFPRVHEALRATVVPGFLAERLATGRIRKAECERWSDGDCGSFSVWLEPPPDVQGWVRKTIELGEAHGFRCERPDEDPVQEWVSSTQICSARTLGYSVQNEQLMLVLSAIIGNVAPRGTPVDCSRDYRPPSPEDTEPLDVQGIPVTRRALDHMEHVLDCYIAHSRTTGGQPQLREWRRQGSLLDRGVGDEPADRVARIELTHESTEPRPADQFRLHIRHALEDGGDVELEVSQHTLDESLLPPVAFEVEFRGADGAALFSLRGDWAEWLAVLAGEAALKAALTEAVELTVQYEAGRGELECVVLPNAAQECHRKPGTLEEEAALAVRLEELRTRLRSYLQQNASMLYRSVTGLYPFFDPACALPYAEAP